jgi:hypothetical protein
MLPSAGTDKEFEKRLHRTLEDISFLCRRLLDAESWHLAESIGVVAYKLFTLNEIYSLRTSPSIEPYEGLPFVPLYVLTAARTSGGEVSKEVRLLASICIRDDALDPLMRERLVSLLSSQAPITADDIA